MRFTVLGSGGNKMIPWPGCGCRVCINAKKSKGKDIRYGNCLYYEDEKILIETPEHVFYHLNKNNIGNVRYIFISHWHPDHCAGFRILEMASQGIGRSESLEKITFITTKNVYELMRTKVLNVDFYLEHFGKLIFVEEKKPFTIGDTKITFFGAPFIPGGDNEVNYFLFEKEDKKVFVANDETRYMDLSEIPDDIDLMIKECGYFSDYPDGTPLINDSINKPAGMETWEHEQSFSGTLEQIDVLKPKKTVLIEIEELSGRTYEDFLLLEKKYKDKNIIFAYDGMRLEI